MTTIVKDLCSLERVCIFAVEIEKPSSHYKKEDVEEYLRNSVVPTCKEIAEYYKVYKKVFN